ncbi:MAG: hypothetical protein AAF721_42600 [Myxococcota bacterium]
MNPLLSTLPSTLLLAGICGAQTPTLATDGAAGVFAITTSENESSTAPSGTAVEFELGQEVATSFVPGPFAQAAITAIDHAESVELIGIAALDLSGLGGTECGTTDGSGGSAPASWLWTLPGRGGC